MSEIAWVGPAQLVMYEVEKRRGRMHPSLSWTATRARDSLLCVLTSGDVVEFLGWSRSQVEATTELLTSIVNGYTATEAIFRPVPGALIAPASELGGDEWLEWLRKEGIL